MKAQTSLSGIAATALLALPCSADKLTGFRRARQYPSKPLVDGKALQDTVSVEPLFAHAQTLQDIAYASPGRNRLAGFEGHNGTVEYIVKTLGSLGDYYDIEEQTFTFEIPVGYEANLTVNDTPYEVANLEYAPPGEFSDVEVVPVANLGCDATDFPVEVSGKVALISRGTCTFAVKSTLAGEAGAVAAIVYNSPGNEAQGTVSGTLGETNPAFVPTAGITRADGLALIAEIEGGATKTVDLSLKGSVPTIYSSNVIATTKGGNANNTLFLGAHSDSVDAGPGINDDGSGTVGLLELAIQLSNFTTANRVRFGWWTGEEEGLLGSTYWVEHASPAELAQIRLYLNFDMIASPNYILGIYDGDGSSFGLAGPSGSDTVETLFENWLQSEGLNFTATEFNGRSDYGPFLDAGIPSGGLDAGADGVKTEEQAAQFGGTAGLTHDPNYHSAQDDVSNLNATCFEIMVKGAGFALGTYARSFDGFPLRNGTSAVTKKRWTAAGRAHATGAVHLPRAAKATTGEKLGHAYIS